MFFFFWKKNYSNNPKKKSLRPQNLIPKINQFGRFVWRGWSYPTKRNEGKLIESSETSSHVTGDELRLSRVRKWATEVGFIVIFGFWFLILIFNLILLKKMLSIFWCGCCDGVVVVARYFFLRICVCVPIKWTRTKQKTKGTQCRILDLTVFYLFLFYFERRWVCSTGTWKRLLGAPMITSVTIGPF